MIYLLTVVEDRLELQVQEQQPPVQGDQLLVHGAQTPVQGSQLSVQGTQTTVQVLGKDQPAVQVPESQSSAQLMLTTGSLAGKLSLIYSV